MLDYVFDSVDTTQSEVYDVLIKPLVNKAIDGYDATFIAIGQTGSGKTYTVGFEDSVSSLIKCIRNFTSFICFD